MNISENLQRILTDKQNIANAINAKGVSCTVSESLDTYADKIAQIQSGGGSGLPEIHDADPLTFVQVRPDYTGSIALVNDDTTAPNAKTFEYNKNDIGWQTYNVGDEITMKYADKVQFRSNDTLPICNANYYRKFITNGVFNCGGDLRSLYPGDIINANYCFRRLFENTKILNVPKLPYTQLKNYCYSYMFSGCNLLISLPENLLPATTIAEYCYNSMFYNCQSLTTLPENLLPATTLASNCYSYMFSKCSSLNTLPENLLPATTLKSYCYSSMFNNCSSLTKSPKLPATTLASSSCYNQMFYYCKKLKEVYCNAHYNEDGSEITTYIGSYWLSGVPNTTDCIFYKNKDWSGPTTRGSETIPSNWQIADYS